MKAKNILKKGVIAVMAAAMLFSVPSVPGNNTGSNAPVVIAQAKSKTISENKAYDIMFKYLKKKEKIDVVEYQIGVNAEKHKKYWKMWVFEDMGDHVVTYGFYKINRKTGKVSKIKYY